MLPSKPQTFNDYGTIWTMKLTNDSYVIFMDTKNFTERYARDRKGWFKVSARGRTFRMTAEQVLNHLLPAVAGIKPNLMVRVEHREKPVRHSGRSKATAPKKRRMVER
jgi:hypothetical protein